MMILENNMAGEKKGKTYEAFVYLSLKKLQEEGFLIDNIYWNKIPAGITIEPDFIIGENLDHPTVVISVTHFTSSKESNRKAWRNIGEICEIKQVFSEKIKTINIVFDSIIKEDMKKMQEIVFGRQLLLGEKEYGKALIEWASSHENSLPTDQYEKADFIDSMCKADPLISNHIGKLKEDIKETLNQNVDSLSQLWSLSSSRNIGFTPNAKDTYFRRGIAKRTLIGSLLKTGEIVQSDDASWLVDLGLVTKTVTKGKYKINDHQLSWFLHTPFAKNYEKISEICATDGFYSQMEKVKALARLDAYNEFIICHYDDLVKTEGMEKCLNVLYKNPQNGINIPKEISAPNNVWIYDYIAALSKAAAGKSQAFGYSVFSSHPLGNEVKIGNKTIGQWCTHFSCEFFNRKPNYPIPDGVVHFLALVLSEELSKYSLIKIQKLYEDIKKEYIAKEYEATFLSHRGYEPLLSLLYYSKIAKTKKDKVTIQTCFAEKGGLDRGSGTATVVKVKNTVILWKSSYDGHPADKRKEIGGLATGIRYTWNKQTNLFEERQGIQKMILLLDGNWKQQHLDFLINSGWDEIYYPDEIDKLKAAIV